MPESSVSPPTLALERLHSVLGESNRWKILTVLSLEQPLMVTEIAQRMGRPAESVSKHLAVMRAAGVVVSGRGRLYQIPAQYLVSPGVVDFGHCLLRLAPPSQS